MMARREDDDVEARRGRGLVLAAILVAFGMLLGVMLARCEAMLR